MTKHRFMLLVVCFALSSVAFPNSVVASSPEQCRVEGIVKDSGGTDRFRIIAIELKKGGQCLSEKEAPVTGKIDLLTREMSADFEAGTQVTATVKSSKGGNYYVAKAIEKVESSDAGANTECPSGKKDEWKDAVTRQPERGRGFKQRSQTQVSRGMGSASKGYQARSAASAQKSAASPSPKPKVGLAAGGAKDINNFRRNIDEGYTPLPQGIRHEGLFYDYRFSVGQGQSCDKLFCPTFEAARSPNPLTGAKQDYLAVGLKSGLTRVERPPLNLVVVLDISGSMSSSFSQYYYDKFGKKQEAEAGDAPKMKVAKQVLSELTEQLNPEDRLGLVLFNNSGHVVKPLRRVKCTKMEAIRNHISDDISEGGGTNMESGIEKGRELLAKLEDSQTAYPRSNRLVFMTDAMPNTGDTDDDSLQGRIRGYTDDRVYTTFIGIGLDANADLIEELTTIRGANAYFVHSEKQFKERLNDEFKYMVTPLAFDVRLTVESPGYELTRTYGTGTGDQSGGTFIEIPTFFPSPTSSKGSKGSILLTQLENTASASSESNRTVSIRASYQTRDGSDEVVERTYTFPAEKKEFYTGTSIQKGVALARWGDLLREWSESAYGQAEGASGSRKQKTTEHRDDDPNRIIPPRPGPIGQVRPLSEWERQSVDLSVTAQWKAAFKAFRGYLNKQASNLPDTDFESELELADNLLSAPEGNE